MPRWVETTYTMKHLSILLIVATSLGAFAQNDLQTAWQRREHTELTSMRVLASWSVTNMAVSGLAIGKAEGSARYFHEMNLYWNAVNLGIAGLGFINVAKARKRSSPPTLSEALEAQQTVEKIILFNTGLDFAYVAGGFYLLEKSKNDLAQQDRLKGFGQAVAVQGGFLLVFDLANYFIHRSNAPRLKKVLDRVTVTGNGVGMVWKL